MLRTKSEKKRTESTYNELIVCGYCLLSAFFILVVCSKCSFMYPMQDGMDANCFFTVGKALVNGKVLYRDIYEHKGIILYLIYGIGYLISNNSFIGIFWLEVFCGALYLYFAYKTVKLFDTKIGVWMMPILALVSYTGYSFSYGGQAEELVLPILSWAFYVFLDYVKNKYPEGKDVSILTVFLMGFFSAILFWIKYTLTGLFLGLVILMAIIKIKEKNWKVLGKMSVIFLLGFFLITIPVLLYFALNQALDSLWEVYFYNLIFRYNERDIGMSRLEYSIRKVLLTFWRNKRFSLLVVVGVGYLTFVKKEIFSKIGKISLWFLCLITTTAIFYSTQYNRYWGEVFLVFAPLGFIPIQQFFDCIKIKVESKKREKRNNYFIIKSAMLLLLLLCCFVAKEWSMNSYLMKYEKEELPQYIFEEIIASDGVSDPEILNYGCLDLGLYTVTETIPTFRYYCDYNIYIPEIYEEQEAYIMSGGPDYIVMRNALEIGEDLYEQVGYCYFEMEFENYYQTYYLYKRRGL